MSITRSSTVVGIFKDRAVAEQAMEALYRTGFEREQIHYSVPGASGGFFEDLKNLFTGSDSTGSIADDLTAMGLSEEETRYYSNEYNAGNTILTVQAAGHEQDALNILHQAGAYNARMSPDLFNQAAHQGSQVAHSPERDDYVASGQPYDIDDWETHHLPRTAEENPSLNPRPDTITPEQSSEDQAAHPNVVTPGHNGEYRPDATPPESMDEFEQLQNQIRVVQQQLEEAKARLQATKEHETHLQTTKEREQKLQSARQQLQNMQAELQATQTELQESQSRIAQYQ